MRRLKASLDDLDTLLSELEAYRAKVEAAGLEIVHRLADIGMEAAVREATVMDAYDSGELVNGIRVEKTRLGGKVVSTAPHSAFVEFGTGIRGKNNPYPLPGLAGWRYDVNEHGEAGWFYYKEGAWHWTAGLPSRPYMYNAAKEVRKRLLKTAKEVMKS